MNRQPLNDDELLGLIEGGLTNIGYMSDEDDD